MGYEVENYSREIIDLICEEFKDDEQLVMNVLRYLCHCITDDKMKSQIEDIFNDYHYCLECGNKLQYYEFQEPHTELTPVAYETIGIYECPVCDRN